MDVWSNIVCNEENVFIGHVIGRNYFRFSSSGKRYSFRADERVEESIEESEKGEEVDIYWLLHFLVWPMQDAFITSFHSWKRGKSV